MLGTYLVEYIGFYYNLTVEVRARDENEAIELGIRLMADEQGWDIDGTFHEVLVTEQKQENN